MIIRENDAGQRLDKFLLKAVPGLPKALMYKFLRTRHIKLNGKKAEISTRLQTGDKLTFFINDEFFVKDERRQFMGAKPDVKVVYEDENVLLLDKPSGRKVDLEADYVCFTIPAAFVVGFGLDYDDYYRNLPFVGVLKPEVYMNK